MAPIAVILGSISGTLSALVGWLLFGLGLWSAFQIYVLVALIVAAGLIGASLLRPKTRKSDDTATLQGI